jgi:hypothetical protein
MDCGVDVSHRNNKVIVVAISEAALVDFLRTVDLPFGNGRVTCAAYSAACCALLQAFGPEWCLKHIGRSEQACDYFQAKKDDYAEGLRHFYRTIEFGELIYNLHDVAGFDERINKIKSDEETGIESGIAELIAGKFFKAVKVMFHYVVTKRIPGQNTPKNPDIEYVAGVNRYELCEVKCHLVSTELNERSIANTLEDARKQLPKGKAGLILLRVPESWLVDMEAGTNMIENAANHFIERKKTTRVSSIFVFASEARFVPGQEKTAMTFLVKEFRNRYCEQGSGIVIPDFSHGVESWRSLVAFAQRVLGG